MKMNKNPIPEYPISINIDGDCFQKLNSNMLFVPSDMSQEEIDMLRIKENKDIYQPNYETGTVKIFPRPVYLKGCKK